MSRSTKVACLLFISVTLATASFVLRGAENSQPAPSPGGLLSARQIPPEVKKEPATGPWSYSINGEPNRSEQKIYHALFMPTDVDFVETPLKDALDFLRDQHNINILLDDQRLQEEGIATDTAITLRISGVRLRSVLQLMFEPLQLEWLIKDEVLTISTAVHASQVLETRIYKIRPLLDAGYSEQELIDAIQQCIRMDSWDINGGNGSLAMLNATLVIRQTQQVHPEIESLLYILEQVAADQKTDKPQGPPRVSLKVYNNIGEKRAVELAKSLPELIEPASWDVSGGPGMIRAVDGSLVVKQTLALQKQVERVLNEFPAPPPNPAPAAAKIPPTP